MTEKSIDEVRQLLLQNSGWKYQEHSEREFKLATQRKTLELKRSYLIRIKKLTPYMDAAALERAYLTIDKLRSEIEQI